MRTTMFRRYAARVTAVAICSAALCTVPMMAQGGGGGGRGMMSPEAQQAQLDSMTKAVGLTPDQVSKIKDINADAMKKMMDIRSSGEDMSTARPKMMAVRTDQQDKIKALLTDDQKPKYDTWLASQPRRGPGGPGGGAPAGGPPAAPPQ
jgi:Spy/CpxP family protein refolding chaperone